MLPRQPPQLLSADVRIGVDGPFRIRLNEVKIDLTMPWFAIKLAELNPEAYAATKLRARGRALSALRSAVETELVPKTTEGQADAP